MSVSKRDAITLALVLVICLLFLALFERAWDQSQAPVVPAAVNAVAPDDEGTAALSPLDFSTP